ncbi:hypothetical protein AXG93_4421s1280 [Marchantia polymorpha subsp. ruderalis]|uniref:Leucine-rich repeat-containing N-terminal plant-type domain-containing protein n=1 Tax=Marchantia polymorpha subsp. ruderalis TaxID=1480154 RepID=A0A176WI39_MARPO|nr:hypothetical protein AXG93_4421s1280 [Marchantia polymorpha subsp. ruderalis]
MSLGLRITRSLQVEVVVLLCVALGVIRSLAQTTDTTVDNGDISCLQSLQDAFKGEGVGFLLTNWTGDGFPCKSNVTYAGLFCSNEHVRDIDLRSMKLEGEISPDISKCSALSNLDLSDNQLTGVIPIQIGQLEQLSKLNLSFNNLYGEIPDFSKALFTNVIDLHNNDLSGSIPTNLGYLLRLTTFDVSYNDLSGPIPPLLANTTTGGVRFNASSFEGNSGLFGYPLQQQMNHGLSVLAIVGIGLGSGMLSLIHIVEALQRTDQPLLFFAFKGNPDSLS